MLYLSLYAHRKKQTSLVWRAYAEGCVTFKNTQKSSDSSFASVLTRSRSRQCKEWYDYSAHLFDLTILVFWLLYFFRAHIFFTSRWQTAFNYVPKYMRKIYLYNRVTWVFLYRVLDLSTFHLVITVSNEMIYILWTFFICLIAEKFVRASLNWLVEYNH